VRLTWVQPEDLLPHELVQSAAEGKVVDDVRARWIAAGGDPVPSVGGASAVPAEPALRGLAAVLLDELDARPAAPHPDEPDDWPDLAALLNLPPATPHRGTLSLDPTTPRPDGGTFSLGGGPTAGRLRWTAPRGSDRGTLSLGDGPTAGRLRWTAPRGSDRGTLSLGDTPMNTNVSVPPCAPTNETVPPHPLTTNVSVPPYAPTNETVPPYPLTTNVSVPPYAPTNETVPPYPLTTNANVPPCGSSQTPTNETVPPYPTPAPGPDYPARVLGAWTGRACGCLLGKPVEKIPRRGIEEILRATGRWPLTTYFTAVGLPGDVAGRWPWNRRSAPTSLEENIAGMPEDDDLNYPMLNLTLLEQTGAGFTTDDVAQLWLDNLPGGRVFTAERTTYRNLLDGIAPELTAVVRNPFREWIGALIRGDVYGWVFPGQPLNAAGLAWTDARLTHTRNGVYGAMWAAGLASAAMVAGSVGEVLDLASTCVPPGSRLATAIEYGRTAASRGRDAGLDALHERYGDLHWVHVLNNAATIAFALELGQGDFGASVAAAVMAGWDTDSVGATVGGVVGALAGADGIGDAWTAPIQGRIATSLPGGEQRIVDLAARTVRLAETLSVGYQSGAPGGPPVAAAPPVREVREQGDPLIRHPADRQDPPDRNAVCEARRSCLRQDDEGRRQDDEGRRPDDGAVGKARGGEDEV